MDPYLQDSLNQNVSINPSYIKENFWNGCAGGLVQAEPDPHGHVEALQRYAGPKAARTEE